MSGECGKCGEHALECSCLLANKMISRIEDIGRIYERFNEIVNHELFDDLGKHNRYWQAEDEKACEKLDEVRRQLSCISDKLWELLVILKREED